MRDRGSLSVEVMVVLGLVALIVGRRRHSLNRRRVLDPIRHVTSIPR